MMMIMMFTHKLVGRGTEFMVRRDWILRESDLTKQQKTERRSPCQIADVRMNPLAQKSILKSRLGTLMIVLHKALTTVDLEGVPLLSLFGTP